MTAPDHSVTVRVNRSESAPSVRVMHQLTRLDHEAVVVVPEAELVPAELERHVAVAPAATATRWKPRRR